MDNISLNSYENLPFKVIFNLFVSRYVKEYGEFKAIKISKEIEATSKVNDYINALLSENHFPSYIDILSILNSTSFFLFSKGETLCLGSLMILGYWNDLGNENSNLLSSKEVSGIAISIIHQCSITKFKRDDNLFTRFYLDINTHTKSTQMEKITQPSDKNYRVFIVRKSSGPHEYPFNINPEYNYMNLELELDGSTYLLKDEIHFDYFEEELEKYQVNKKFILKITNYKIEQSGDKYVLLRNK